MKEVIQKERLIKYTECKSLKCDICGNSNLVGNENNWESGYQRDVIKIKRDIGACYPGDCFGDVTEVHMCPSCWEDKFIPWVKSFDIIKELYTYDY